MCSKRIFLLSLRFYCWVWHHMVEHQSGSAVPVIPSQPLPHPEPPGSMCFAGEQTESHDTVQAQLSNSQNTGLVASPVTKTKHSSLWAAMENMKASPGTPSKTGDSVTTPGHCIYKFDGSCSHDRFQTSKANFYTIPSFPVQAFVQLFTVSVYVGMHPTTSLDFSSKSVHDHI